MPLKTDEEIRSANAVNLPDFLMEQGENLVKSGRGYRIKEHNSLFIQENKWYWNSRSKGGNNIKFIMEYYNLPFYEAVDMLNKGRYISQTREYVTENKPPTAVDRKHEVSIVESGSKNRAIAYLTQTRKLDYSIVTELVRQGLITQDSRNNVVFKVIDENGTLVGGELVGTASDYRFKGIIPESAYGYGFEICKGTGENALFFESAIDLLSYMQLYSDELDNHRLISMIGVKPATVEKTIERYGISPQNTFLCVDNDEAGVKFVNKLKKEYPEMHRISTVKPYKDWNEQLKEKIYEKTLDFAALKWYNKGGIEMDISSTKNLYADTIKQVTTSAEEWEKFLRISAELNLSEKQQEHDFSSKLLVYRANPNVTECKTFAEWKAAGNPVALGASGIPVLTDNEKGEPTVAYVFDVSQTANPENKSIKHKITESNKQQVMDQIAEIYGTTNNSIENLIADIVFNEVNGLNISEDKKSLAASSMCYAIYHRFGLDVDYDYEEFQNISSMSIRDIAEIGIAMNNIAVPLENTLYNAIAMENERSFEHEQLQEQGRDRVHLERGSTAALSDVQEREQPVVQTGNGNMDISADDRVGNTSGGVGQVRNNENELPEKSQTGGMARTDMDKSALSALHTDKRGRSDADRADNRQENKVGGIQGSDERLHENISAPSAVSDGSRGTGNADDLRVKNSTKAELDNNSNSAFSVQHEQLIGMVLSDSRVQNAAQNSDIQNLKTEIEAIISDCAVQILNQDIMGNIGFYNDFMQSPDRKAELVKTILDNAKISQSVETAEKNENLNKKGEQIIGNTPFRYIGQKTYTKVDKDIADRIAQELENRGIKFSGVIRDDNATITVSSKDRSELNDIINKVNSVEIVEKVGEKEENTAESEQQWDVRISRALNISNGVASYLSESEKNINGTYPAYVYGSYQSYDEAQTALAELRKAMENNPEMQQELFNKCPYYEREIGNMEITLDGEVYRVHDIDRLSNTIDLMKLSYYDTTVPHIILKNKTDLPIRTEAFDYIDSIVNERNTAIPVQTRSADELTVGDVIRYMGDTLRITNIDGDFSINFENVDKTANTVNAVASSIFGHWKETVEKNGFEYVRHDEHELMESTRRNASRKPKDVITDNQLSLFGEDVNEISDVKSPDTLRADGLISDNAMITEDMFMIDSAEIRHGKSSTFLSIGIAANDEFHKRLADRGLTPNENSNGTVIIEIDDYNWNRIVLPDTFGNKWNSIQSEDVLTTKEFDILRNVFYRIAKESEVTADKVMEQSEQPKKNEWVAYTQYIGDEHIAQIGRVIDNSQPKYSSNIESCGKIFSDNDLNGINVQFAKNLANQLNENNIDSIYEAEKYISSAITEQELDKAKEYISSYVLSEFDSEAGFSDLHHISTGYTELGENNKYPFQMEVDLIDFSARYYIGQVLVHTEQYNSLEQMNADILSCLDFSDFVSIGEAAVERMETSQEKENVATAESKKENNWRMYVIPDLKTWADNGKSGVRTPIEYYDTFEEAKRRFDELRTQPYNAESVILNGNPAARLTLGIDSEIKRSAVDILHVRDNKNCLVDDFSRMSSIRDDVEAVGLIKQTASEIGYDTVLSFSQLENGQRAKEPVIVPFSEWNEFDLKMETQQEAESTVISEFRRKTAEMFNSIDGYSPDDIENLTREYAQNIFMSNDVTAEVGNVIVTGSRSRGLENEISDIDVVVEVSSELKEYALFNLLHDTEIEIGGIPVDINPIRSEETGTLETYLPSVEAYLEEKAVTAEQKKENDISSADKFYIYQMKSGEEYHYARFSSIETIAQLGIKLDISDYDMVYSGDLNKYTSERPFENIYFDFNRNRPEDFKGHSLSVSDVIVIEKDGIKTAHFCDDMGFTDMPSFFNEKERDIEDKNVTNEKPTTIEIGDKFKNKFTGEISEVISLTGALSWIKEDCTVQRISDGFVITENVPYSKLFDDNLYEYIGRENAAENVKEAEHGKWTVFTNTNSNGVEFGYIGRLKDVTQERSGRNTEWCNDYFDDNVEGFNIGFARSIAEELNEKGITDLKAAREYVGHAVTERENQLGLERNTSLLDEIEHTASEREKKDDDLDILVFDDKSNTKTPDDIQNLAEAIGCSERLLRGMIILGYSSNAMEKLKYTVDKPKAQKFLEGIEERPLDMQEVNAKLDLLLKNFVVQGGFDISQIKKSDLQVELPSQDTSENQSRFRITDYQLGEGGAKLKFARNIEAIKTLKAIEADERTATPEEQEILSKYVGWGGLQDAFDSNNTAWENEFYTLSSLLTDEEYEAARRSTLDAFYTSPVIVEAIYQALDNIGFDGGNVLEPALGVGNFFGIMPDKMRDESHLMGVELDSISGRIAKQLYPEADITISGYEKMKFENNQFDVAVGNVPFGETSPNDKIKAYQNLKIHDYFFAKTADKVRSGGIIAFVTSSGTLDKQNTHLRKMLAQKCELLGAIRLPNNAFKKNAGTEVTSDIIFLQKREKPLKESEIENCNWIHIDKSDNGLPINQYFAENPQMVLGTLDTDFRGNTICKAYPDKDIKEQLAEAVKNIKGMYSPPEFQPELNEKSEEVLLATPDIPNFTYTVVDEKLYYRRDDFLIPLKESEQTGTKAARRKGMCELADTAKALLNAQVEGMPDDVIENLQKQLNTQYDKFVEKYGYINKINSKVNPNAVFKNDVRFPLLQSLEKTDGEHYFGKADIFEKRTITPHKAIEHTDTSSEALIVSISEKSKVDLDYMAELTGFEKQRIIDELKGVIYPVPELSNDEKTVYQTAEEYLSGNIYEKLAVAETAAEQNPMYASNVEVLQKSLPEPLTAGEITVKLGATWIDPKIMQQFMYEVFDTPQSLRAYETVSYQHNKKGIELNFSSAGKGEWYISNKSSDAMNVNVNSTYGTADMNAYEILEATLNLRSPKIYKKVDNGEGKEVSVLDQKATEMVNQKVQSIKNAFSEWIFKDPERRQYLVDKYNHLFNCIRPREYDGSYLKFSGMNPEIKLRSHQVNAIAHALFGGNSLFAHEVGAGKTFEMIATAMEGKRLGLHNKCMFAVPNHLTEQIASDFMKLYPNANILVAKPDDFSSHNRKKMCAKIATGNFDAVIVGHSQLIKIPLSPEREKEYIKGQINEITSAIEFAKNESGDKFTVKQMEKTKQALQDKLDKLINSTVKDQTVTFEELGIDKLFVDEAHLFKNLFLSTKMSNISGITSNDNVQKTQDLYMKCQYLDEITGSRGVTFATGTPVSNSMTEIYSMMKYLQSDELEKHGLKSFDSWAATFGDTVTEGELSPDNRYRMKTRFAKFVNVPELMNIFKQCADIKTADMLNLDVPECEKIIERAEPSELQVELIKSLSERAEKVHNRLVEPSEDNMLTITSDGRKIGLDPRLIDPEYPDYPDSKLNMCVNNVFDIWQETADKRSTQLIFCDLGVPQTKEDIKKNGKRFSVYDDIKQKLIERGVPENEIAFIHDAGDSEVKKAQMFSKVRSGEIRVLIGSTAKMGAGTNVQDKLIASHDLDCPWKPADMTQRAGRMIRQGNENEDVKLFRYVTNKTFDAYLFQTLEKKQNFISQVMTSKSPARTMDDIDEQCLEFAEIKALCAGDPRIKRRMDLEIEVTKYKMLKSGYLNQRYALEDGIMRTLPKQIASRKQSIAGITEDIKKAAEYSAPINADGEKQFLINVNGKTFTDKKEAGTEIKAQCATKLIGNNGKPVVIGEYKGFPLAVSFDDFGKQFKLHLCGDITHTTTLGDSDTGNFVKLDNLISGMETRLEGFKKDLEALETQLEKSRKQLDVPFEFEDELRKTETELIALTAELESAEMQTDMQDNEVGTDDKEIDSISAEKEDTASSDISEDKPESSAEVSDSEITNTAEPERPEKSTDIQQQEEETNPDDKEIDSKSAEKENTASSDISEVKPETPAKVSGKEDTQAARFSLSDLNNPKYAPRSRKNGTDINTPKKEH